MISMADAQVPSGGSDSSLGGAIDVHAHVIVPELLREVDPSEPWRPAILRDDGRHVIECGQVRVRSAVHELVDVEAILAIQRSRGIERVVLCPWVGLLFYDVEPEEALRRCRLQNEGLARARARCPERVSVLGSVPLQDPELAAHELEVLLATGEFSGVEVTASVNGTYLGDARFEPFWETAERAGALVFVHPATGRFSDPVFGQRYLHNLVGNPMETTVAAAHLVLGGVMESHPALKVLLAHGGGAITALRGRLRRGQRVVEAAGKVLTESADRSIGRFLFDTVTHDSAVLRELVGVVGADRVLLGSDYPFDMGDPDPLRTVREAGLDPAVQEALVRGNAERLLKVG